MDGRESLTSFTNRHVTNRHGNQQSDEISALMATAQDETAVLHKPHKLLSGSGSADLHCTEFHKNASSIVWSFFFSRIFVSLSSVMIDTRYISYQMKGSISSYKWARYRGLLCQGGGPEGDRPLCYQPMRVHSNRSPKSQEILTFVPKKMAYNVVASKA